MITERAESRICAASSALALCTVRSSCAPPALVWTWPKAPNSTLVNDRFIARHMTTERMKPEEPSSEPAMISKRLPRANPMAAAESPA